MYIDIGFIAVDWDDNMVEAMIEEEMTAYDDHDSYKDVRFGILSC
jgi:hypothetical protein